MLLSSIILIIAAAFTNNFYFLAFIFVYGVVLLAVKKNEKDRKKIVSLKLIMFTIFTALFQIFFISTGKVLIYIWNIVITSDGVYSVCLTSMKIFCIMLLSWTINYRKINLEKINHRYSVICKTSVKVLPEVLPIIKQKFSFKYILRKVYKAVLIEMKINEEVYENKKN